MRHKLLGCFLILIFSFSFVAFAAKKVGPADPESVMVAIASIEARIAEIDLERARAEKEGEKLAHNQKLVDLVAERIRLEKQLRELKKKLPKTPLEQPEIREARKRLEKQDGAAEKATRESEKAARKVAEKQERARRNQQKVYARANIAGCQPGSVWVAPEATAPTYGTIKVRINILNNDPEFAVTEIRDEQNGHTVVRNLCPGGMMTIIKRHPILVDSYTVTVAYSAYGPLVNGRRLVSHSPTTSMFTGGFGGLQPTDEPLDWKICFGTVPCRSR